MSRKILIFIAICFYSTVLSFAIDTIGRVNYGKRSEFFITNSKQYYNDQIGCRVDYKISDQEEVSLVEFVEGDDCPDNIEVKFVTEEELQDRLNNYEENIVVREQNIGLINPNLLSR
ncbi:hypothetical protein HC766_04055 [Candidatus Gracilibacteria bacterium]|nr:hypothetical protein [Candidatus Gracilibacteria bacterium]NJS41502.1 hypothetical protein [Candidatus Gracilibacteria bacterium]